MLATVRLPAGARQVQREPSGDNRFLRSGGSAESEAARGLAERWWIVPGSPTQALAYLKAHQPSGSTLNETGTAGDGHTGSSAWTAGFGWPPVAGVLGYREVNLTVTALHGGRTGVLAEAVSQWIVVRLPSEVVPAGVRGVVVTLSRVPPKARPILHTAAITEPRRVRRAVALVDSLAVAQPGALMCTEMILPARLLTVTFSAGPAGPVLAKAELTLYAHGEGGADACDPIRFWIRGRVQTALVGTSFARQIEALAGIRTR
jgi:hypothetical protein